MWGVGYSGESEESLTSLPLAYGPDLAARIAQFPVGEADNGKGREKGLSGKGKGK